MIFQIIDNITWASLLVNESKTWRRKIGTMENRNDRECKYLNSKDSNKTIHIAIQENGADNV
jgi:hypothetical protein